MVAFKPRANELRSYDLLRGVNKRPIANSLTLPGCARKLQILGLGAGHRQSGKNSIMAAVQPDWGRFADHTPMIEQRGNASILMFGYHEYW